MFDLPASASVGGGIIAETLSIAPLTDVSGLLAPDIPYKQQKGMCIVGQYSVYSTICISMSTSKSYVGQNIIVQLLTMDWKVWGLNPGGFEIFCMHSDWA